MNALPSILIALAIALTPYSVTGVGVASATVTISTLLLVLAVIATVLMRAFGELPPIPSRVLKEPAIVVTLIYFVVGLCTYFAADNKSLFTKEVIQRVTIIWIPLYVTVLGLRNMDQARRVLLWYLPLVTLLSACSVCAAAFSGFSKPIYLFGLHKNLMSGLSASMAIICIAHLITSKRPRFKLIFFELPNRPLFLTLAGISLLGIVATQGRGGLLEVLAAVFCMMVAGKVKRSTLIKVAAVFIVFAIGLGKLLPEQTLDYATTFEMHSSNQVRAALWTESYRRFCANPFFLSGWGNGYFDESGHYYLDMVSVFFYDLMQMSLVGAVLLLVMIFLYIKLGLDNAKLLSLNSQAAFVNMAAMGIVAGKFAHGMVDVFWIARGHILQIWTCVGLLLFIKLSIEQQRSTKIARTAVRVRSVVPGASG